jgi:5-methylcytosine-specific restriction protein A
MSIRRTQALYSKKQAMDQDGKALCLVCDGSITGRRKTFCSKPCSEDHYIRTRPSFARLKVFERDKGVCAGCGLDTMAGRVRIAARGTGHLWQADHIIPVVEGGGECGLENLRTLCRACHLRETAELARRRAEARKRKAEEHD